MLLECSGNARATWEAVSSMARAGRVVLVGMGGDTVQLPLSYVQDREPMITGAFRYANTWPTAIQLVASGRVDLDSMVTGQFGLHDVAARVAINWRRSVAHRWSGHRARNRCPTNVRQSSANDLRQSSARIAADDGVNGGR